MRNYNDIYRIIGIVSIYSRRTMHLGKIGITKFHSNYMITVRKRNCNKICFVDLYCESYHLSYIGSGDLLTYINQI